MKIECCSDASAEYVILFTNAYLIRIPTKDRERERERRERERKRERERERVIAKRNDDSHTDQLPGRTLERKR